MQPAVADLAEVEMAARVVSFWVHGKGDRVDFLAATLVDVVAVVSTGVMLRHQSLHHVVTGHFDWMSLVAVQGKLDAFELDLGMVDVVVVVVPLGVAQECPIVAGTL